MALHIQRAYIQRHFLEELSSKRRHAEAARVFLDYAGDVRQAVIAFSEGNLFAEARRTVRFTSLDSCLTTEIF